VGNKSNTFIPKLGIHLHVEGLNIKKKAGLG
jgi:hypothetical protein